MKYGKLFRAFTAEHTEMHTLSANKTSELTHGELVGMAKRLFPKNKLILADYPHATTEVLAKKVYKALKATYR